MMLQEAIAIRNPVVCFPGFYDVDVDASQTDEQLVCNAAVHKERNPPKAGWIIGLVIELSAAATAGSLTVGVTINGTEEASTTQTITTGTQVIALFKVEDAIRFVAGDAVGVEITTDGDWNGTTADLNVDVYAVLEDWEF